MAAADNTNSVSKVYGARLSAIFVYRYELSLMFNTAKLEFTFSG